MNSIIQEKKECYVCSSINDLEVHHCIYGNAKRKLSDKYGLVVWLCRKHHRTGKYAVHFFKPLDDKLKELAQQKAMNYYNWSLDDWMKIFRRNYL